jgi:hypothetical protein
MGNYVITAESKPKHDKWGLYDDWGIFGFYYWSCLDWIEWHKALVKKYGKEKADKIWATEYDNSEYLSHETFCPGRNDEFRNYIKKEGLIPKSSILTRIFRAESSLDKLSTPFKNIWSSITNITGTAKTTTKTLSYAIPVVVGLAAVGLIVFGYVKFIRPELLKK